MNRDPYHNGGDADIEIPEIVSFPESLERKIEQARRLLHPAPAPADELYGSASASVFLELARNHPELATLALASQRGAKRIVSQRSETITRTIVRERFAAGVRYAHEVETITDAKVNRNGGQLD